jgi:isobutyryl-CoA mutase
VKNWKPDDEKLMMSRLERWKSTGRVKLDPLPAKILDGWDDLYENTGRILLT